MKELIDLLAAANDFAARVLGEQPAHLRDSLAVASLYVTVSTRTSSAAVIVEGAQEALLCLARKAPTPELGAASASVMEAGVGRLTDAARRGLAFLQQQGAGVGLVIALPIGPVQLQIDDGSPEPRLLATLSAEPSQVH
jgi:hypothetical protein